MKTTAQAIPPQIKSAPSVGLFIGIVLAAVFLGVTAMIYFFNPTRYGFYPVCPFHEMTGLNCPGCGGTRSFYALLHGHFQAAFKDNALFICSLVFFGIRGGWFAQRKFFGKPVGQFFPAKWLWPLLMVVAIFFIVRNLPAFSFLSP